MPNLFIINGYRFFFFSNEGFEPMHVHVEKAGKYAKFWLKPVRLARNQHFNSLELSKLHSILEHKENEIERKWNEYFNFS